MNLLQSDDISNLLLFIIPGFISLKFYDFLVPSERRDFSKSLIEIFAYSGFNYAIFYKPLVFINSSEIFKYSGFLSFVSFILIFVLMPAIWPVVFIEITSTRFLSRYVRHPISKPWDYLFSKNESLWVIVHLRNGRKIGGVFGKKSFASSYPAEEQIYLETVWELDEEDNFKAPIARSKGIIILRDEISAVEFFK